MYFVLKKLFKLRLRVPATECLLFIEVTSLFDSSTCTDCLCCVRALRCGNLITDNLVEAILNREISMVPEISCILFLVSTYSLIRSTEFTVGIPTSRLQ